MFVIYNVGILTCSKIARPEGGIWGWCLIVLEDCWPKVQVLLHHQKTKWLMIKLIIIPNWHPMSHQSHN